MPRLGTLDHLLSTEEVVVARVTAGPMYEGTASCADTCTTCIQPRKITNRAVLVAIVYFLHYEMQSRGCQEWLRGIKLRTELTRNLFIMIFMHLTSSHWNVLSRGNTAITR